MTNEEAIQLLKELWKRSEYGPEYEYTEALAKAIDALTPKPCENTEQKVTMTNAEWCVKNGISFSHIGVGLMPEDKGGDYRIIESKKGIKKPIGIYPRLQNGKLNNGETAEALKKWLDDEHKDYKEPEPILTGEERGYLKQVIRPFRDKVEYIEILNEIGKDEKNYHYLEIRYKNTMNNYLCQSPLFEPEKYFKGMKLYKHYTLQELGL